jgi:hypothetical protein
MTAEEYFDPVGVHRLRNHFLRVRLSEKSRLLNKNGDVSAVYLVSSLAADEKNQVNGWDVPIFLF